MPRRYPIMRQRPEEFRLNPESPLYEGLVFAGLGGHGCVGSMVYPDASPFHNHGVAVSAAASTLWSWSYKIGRHTVNLHSTTGDYISIENRSNLVVSDQLTVCFWININYYTSSDFGSVVNKRNSSNVGGWTVEPAEPYWYFWLYLSSWRSVTLPTTLMPVLEWHHLAAVYTGTSQSLVLNGVQRAYRAQSGAINEAPNSEIKIGQNIANTSHQLDGSIADMCIYRRSLTLMELDALADPSNVDLRVGGVPLILPPRRRWWPVVTPTASKVPWHLFTATAG